MSVSFVQVLIYSGILGSCAWILGRSWRAKFHPLERFGLVGFGLLGALGWISFAVAWLIPSGAKDLPISTITLLAVLMVTTFIVHRRAEKPESDGTHHAVSWIWIAAFAVLLLIPLVKSFAPSDPVDWDTLAYHLAVPKLWLQAGQVTYIPFIHQSNFPFVIDSLFMLGLSFSEPLAKIHTFLYLVFGVCWIYGACRRRAGMHISALCALAYLSTPLILWSSGSGYIDVAHGLLGAVGLLYFAELWEGAEERPVRWMLVGAGLGLALASKYTGLQIVLALLPALILGFAQNRTLKRQADFRPFAMAAVMCLVIAAPWYIRNTLNTGNPVYPFFYEKLGGKGWDQFRADIYRNEQQSFGVGHQPDSLGHALLGLTYQPGRYINPGQSIGLGFPMGALGPVLLLALLFAVLFELKHPAVRIVAEVMLLYSLQWFFLSQQVRYFTVLLPLAAWTLAILLANQKRAAPLFCGLISVQAVFTFLMLKTVQMDTQLMAISGKLPQDYYYRMIPFTSAARSINNLEPGSKIALYDEVFGYYLDIPYWWANPGHNTAIPYETMQSGQDWARDLRSMGFTHVYVALSLPGTGYREELALGLGALGEPQLPSTERRDALMTDLQTKWQALMMDAVQRGYAEPVETFGAQDRPSGILLQLTRPRS